MTWAGLEGYCLDIAQQIGISGWRPDIIVGIIRGGAVPAVMLSHFLKCEMIGLKVSLRDSTSESESNGWISEEAANGKKILIVDDINDTGATINWIINDWNSTALGIEWGDTVRFATIVDNESSQATITPKYCGLTINKANNDVWIEFPYENLWHKESPKFLNNDD